MRDGSLHIGRPRDPDLTRRLLRGALAQVAEQGILTLSVDSVRARAGAGKAGLYRRWTDVHALLADALRQGHLLDPSPPAGDLRTDLMALMRPVTEPLSSAEQAASAALGLMHHVDDVRQALDDALVQPLASAVSAIVDDHARRGHHVTDVQRRLLVSVVQALWWDRYVRAPDVRNLQEVSDLVDGVLVPTLAGGTAR